MDDPQGGAAGRDELIHDLADAIAGDATFLLKDWKQLVLVSQIEDGAPDLTGFCYTGTAAPSWSRRRISRSST